jgi:NAD(P)-dependent dehydrogenase (short-subunit alcohol dehydrogenase family)
MPPTADPRRYVARPDLHAGRIVLVTGASDGIGRAVAQALAAHGATVLLHGRSQRKLERVYDAIVAAGHPRPAILPLDLEKAVAQDYDALAAAIDAEFGRLDGLLLNAAILGARTPIEQYDVPTWCRVLHVNLTAAFILMQVCLPLLRRSPDPAIVCTTSSVGQRGRAYWGAYAVSKFGLEGLAQVLAHEIDGHGTMRVNLVNPGATRTSLRAQAYPAEDVAQLARPEDVVPTFLYLLGPDSAGVNGQRFDCRG